MIVEDAVGEVDLTRVSRPDPDTSRPPKSSSSGTTARRPRDFSSSTDHAASRRSIPSPRTGPGGSKSRSGRSHTIDSSGSQSTSTRGPNRRRPDHTSRGRAGGRRTKRFDLTGSRPRTPAWHTPPRLGLRASGLRARALPNGFRVLPPSELKPSSSAVPACRVGQSQPSEETTVEARCGFREPPVPRANAR